MAVICKARLLSDVSGQTACDKPATSLDGRLCAFHSRQCQALYRGYKRRNAQLDALSSSRPPYFAKSKTALINEEFKEVETENQLREIHTFLFKKYNLLDRVIRARRLHHSHFFAIDYDYGHEKYLAHLQSERLAVSRALEKLGRKGSDIMYKDEKWADWVHKCQDDEDSNREKEAKKIKLEALLFQRHQKEVQQRQREVQRREEQKRQEAFLDEVYQKRLLEMSEDSHDEEWDPVQDSFEEEKESYVDLIKYFLMLKEQEVRDAKEASVGAKETAPEETGPDSKPPEKTLSRSAKKRARKANSETNKLANPSASTSDRGPDTIAMETREQMRGRLTQRFPFQRSTGWYAATDEGPIALDAKTPSIPENEVDTLLDEIAEIKNFLFCRLLLSHATLLPLALKANSIDEFLSSDQLTTENLRDLCLKLERPKLQDLRDACADFIRGEQEETESDDHYQTEDEDDYSDYSSDDGRRKLRICIRPTTVPDKFSTKREKAAQRKRLRKRAISGGKENLTKENSPDKNEPGNKRMRIKVCGRYMFNYRSEMALGRGGWFHFSVIAKDSNLFDAIELCRNWNEFFELSILCIHNFFPAPKWTMWVGDMLRQQLLMLGFIPYFILDKAEKLTHFLQTGSRGLARRAHQVLEVRNFVCAHIKRDDPVSRRFIQYLSMETFELMALVRDPKTGRTLIRPPDEELWLVREKSGWGRANKAGYNIIEKVGPEFFERTDQMRKWHFGFDDYYDVYVWDADIGQSYFRLQRRLEEILMRALRVRNFKDCFTLTAPILKTIGKDPASGNTIRTIRPGEDIKSLWDTVSPESVFEWCPETGERAPSTGIMTTYKYTEADEIEDRYLFPDEDSGGLRNNLFKKLSDPISRFEDKPSFDLQRWVNDVDTDDTLDEDSDDDYEYRFADEWDDEEDKRSERSVKSGGSGDSWVTTDESDDGNEHAHAPYRNKTAVPPKEWKKATDMLSEHFKKSLGPYGKPDYFMGVLTGRNQRLLSAIPKIIKDDPYELMGTLRYSLMQYRDYSDTRHEKLHADFIRHIDREKSKIFKSCWHRADLEPDAHWAHISASMLIDAMDEYNMEKLDPGPFQMMQLMNPADMFKDERRIVEDVFLAWAAISLFMNAEPFGDSPRSRPNEKLAELFKRDPHLLYNQKERAKHLPDRRTHHSKVTMPKEIWSEFDQLLKDKRRRTGESIEDIYPDEWRKALRPILMKFYRNGIIQNSYSPRTEGVAIIASEPGRQPDMYIDFRHMTMPNLNPVRHLQDPTPFTREFLIKKAANFSKEHPKAKFAALRIWSAPHFYPLMFGEENRMWTSFLDDRGRAWQFRFIPKDMPYSEWSMHHQLRLRLEPWQEVFEKQVFVARDLLLVMGKDAEDLRMLASCATFAVQTRPWRMEIDLWRSFVNVDLQFLEELDPKWLE